MNTLSLETAKALRSAGYPTPALDKGQSWFIPFGGQPQLTYFATTPKDGHLIGVAENEGIVTLSTHSLLNVCYYLPTLEELLRQLPGYSLMFDGQRFSFDGSDLFDEHPCAIELAAKLWIKQAYE